MISSRAAQATLRVQDDLRPALIALIEVPMGVRRSVESNVVRNQERRLGPVFGDEIA
jgi:hypothetical protein